MSTGLGESRFTKSALDTATALTMTLTLVLFLLGAVEKGLTRELLLEAGVFLVSVKLMLTTHSSAISLRALEAKLDAVLKELEKR